MATQAGEHLPTLVGLFLRAGERIGSLWWGQSPQGAAGERGQSGSLPVASFSKWSFNVRFGSIFFSYKRWQKLEQGIVNPTVKTLVRVAQALDLPFWTLFWEDLSRARRPSRRSKP